MKVIEWLMGYDTGISSKAMVSVFTGKAAKGLWDMDTPRDPDDFGRCYRMMNQFPEWYSRLDEIPEVFPNWGPMIGAWPELCAMYEKVCDDEGRYTPNKDLEAAESMYVRMRQLNDEGLIADGWIQTHPGCWERGNASSFDVRI